MCPLLPIRKPVLCYVTDRKSLTGDAARAKELLLKKIEAVAAAGVDWIQLREKDLCARELAELTVLARERIGPKCKMFVSDRLDVALAKGADGAHLGEQGLPVAEAKRLLNEQAEGRVLLLGVSVHSLASAREAEGHGADYLIFGPIFPTPSKASFGAPQGLEKLREICAGAKIPVIAIGGITVEHFRGCLRAGASGIAAIRLFQDTRDLPALVSQWRNLS